MYVQYVYKWSRVKSGLARRNQAKHQAMALPSPIHRAYMYKLERYKLLRAYFSSSEARHTIGGTGIKLL